MNITDNLSLILQVISVEALMKDFKNFDLMSELQTQDEKYLKQIIRQNNEIIGLIKEGRDNGGRETNEKDRRVNK